MTAFDAPFTAADIDFVYGRAGGHPRLLNGVCRVLEEALEENGAAQDDPTARWQFYEQVMGRLRQDEELTLECDKIWQKLSESEQAALIALPNAESPAHEAALTGLLRQHILLKVEGKYQPFCSLFAESIQRHIPPQTPVAGQLWVDSERGAVLVNGQAVEALTNLEYRLISLLFANRDKIIDKYQIVTNVWGDSYIDEVDDARIEKLVSRVRQKIEADPSTPHFLMTVRGRGYRLVVE